ncbi:MAG: UxaA family hydrolase, partial [Novibacillus thermophilus]
MTDEPVFTVIQPDDSVCVALRDLAKGDTVEVNGHCVTVREDVPFGHKVAVKTVHPGEDVLKYGYS